MNTSRIPQPLSDPERTRVEALLTKFSEAWRTESMSNGEVFLSMFLPSPDDRLYVLMLHQLIPTDLAYRWRRGEKPLLEKYLESFPELGSSDDLPTELIYDEFRIRGKHGDSPTLESYQQRFPKQHSTLRSMLTQTVNASLTRTIHELPGRVEQTLPPEERSFSTAATAKPPHASESGSVSSSPLRSESSRRIMPGGEGYELIEHIGHGAFADVWRAEAPGGIEVAVKIIRWTASNKLSQVELRALELIKRLRHPFLLQVQAYWLSEGQLYIVMDLADRTLHQRLEACRAQGLPGIPVDELLTYMREVAEALDHLHKNNVLHRDIKPANIMLASGHAKLADFGLARLVLEKGVDVRATTTGTPLYMSPEVWVNQVSPASDQYSLASTYVELRQGRPLFTTDTYADVMRDHMHTRPDLTGIPDHEQQVLHRALAKDINARYGSCLEFVEALQHAVERDSRPPDRTLARRLVLVCLLLLGMVGVAAAGAQWLRPKRTLALTAPATTEITAGEEATFEIHLLGAQADDIAPPEFFGLPDGVTLKPVAVIATEPASTSDTRVWRVSASGDLNMPSATHGQTYEVTARARDGARLVERPLQLKVLPPNMVLPAGCIPAPGAVRVHVVKEGKNYWDRIVRELPNDLELSLPCEFILVPYDGLGPKPASFYFQKNKVWNELFDAFNREYLRANPEQQVEDNEDWPADWKHMGAAKGATDMPAEEYPLHPAMRVSYPQAIACAEWLGGKLPTCDQWDVAAGLFLPTATTKQGPFKGEWIKTQPLQIAVNRSETGTLPVGSSSDDVTPLGICDMAGNGAEWTRDVSSGDFSTVVLRGRRYDKFQPLMYDHLREKEKQIDPKIQNEVEREEPKATSPYIGFRVVIEP